MDDALAAVEGMLADRVSFASIEDYIEARHDLHKDHKSALWLLAWAETERHERRRAVGELLKGLAHSLA